MKRQRRLFCEISPVTYAISSWRCRMGRHLHNLIFHYKLATDRETEPLPILIHSHKSLIRRRLGNVEMQLQENKAVNLALAAPKVSHILIRPGETFSFWHLVGSCTAGKGYREGLTICRGAPGKGIGGGMCQMTNLIHWLILHSPLTITEHHHHDGVDLFPDFGRQVPFGVGTSILYNYLDYRFYNGTQQNFQLILFTTDDYLCGELRAEVPLPCKYHIRVEGECFVTETDGVYRQNHVYRDEVDKKTGKLLAHSLIKVSHAKVMYDPALCSPQPAQKP